MITYFNNPYDKVSINTLQLLFVNGLYPSVINRTSLQDTKGLWVSFLPTIVLSSDDYVTEHARIEDYTKITVDAVTWLFTQQANIVAGGTIDKTNIPSGVILP